MLVRGLGVLNARHPWSHNDHFHPWILRHLPERRRRAVDVGCGQGALVTALASHFDQVTGTDVDAGMRAAASARTAGLTNVSITGERLADLEPGIDLITMVAVLHHLDLEPTLTRVRDLLTPGGRLLVVGLAPVRTRVDLAWDVASALTNPVIGMVKHPRPHRGPRPADPFPTSDPTASVDHLREALGRHLPGARLRRRLAFRHTIEWTRPVS